MRSQTFQNEGVAFRELAGTLNGGSRKQSAISWAQGVWASDWGAQAPSDYAPTSQY